MRSWTTRVVFIVLCMAICGPGCGPLQQQGGQTSSAKGDRDGPYQGPPTDTEKADELERLAGDGAWCGVTRQIQLPRRVGRKVYFAASDLLWTTDLDKGLSAITTNGKHVVAIDASIALEMCKDWVPNPDAEDPWDGTCNAYEREFVTDDRAQTGWQFQWAALELSGLAGCAPGSPHRPYQLDQSDPRRYNNMWKVTVRVPPPSPELWALGGEEPVLDRDAFVFDTVDSARAFIDRAYGVNLGCGDPIRYHYQSKSAETCQSLSPISCGPSALYFSDQCGCGCRRQLSTTIDLTMECGPRG